MKRSILLMVFLLPLLGRAQTPHVDSSYVRYWQFTFEDDYIKLFGRHNGSIDRYYTSGLKLEHYSTSLRRNFIEKAMPFSRHYTSKAFSYALGCNMYTPVKLYLSTVDSTDRPYAGYLYVSGRGTFNDTIGHTRRITVEYSAGVLGPPTLQGPFQKFVHNAIQGGIPSAHPKGWDNQISTAIALNVNFRFEPAWLHSCMLQQRMNEGKSIFEIFPTTELNIGSVMDYLRAGMLFTFQTGGGVSYFQSEYTFNTIHPARVGEVRVAAPKKCIYFDFYLKPSVTALAYNSTLSGGLLAFETSKYTLTSHRVDHFYFQLDGGFIMRTKGFGLLYSNTFRSAEFDGGLSSSWGTVSLLFGFKTH